MGVKTEGQKQGAKVRKLEVGEVLMVNIGSTATGARVVAVRADMARLQLTSQHVPKSMRRLPCLDVSRSTGV